jgi:hypothetical protein
MAGSFIITVGAHPDAYQMSGSLLKLDELITREYRGSVYDGA